MLAPALSPKSAEICECFKTGDIRSLNPIKHNLANWPEMRCLLDKGIDQLVDR